MKIIVESAEVDHNPAVRRSGKNSGERTLKDFAAAAKEPQ